MRLDQLQCGTTAQIATIDWSQLSGAEARRLRELGFDAGVEVRALHKAPFGHDPLAIEVGRMVIAMRRAVAQSVSLVATDRFEDGRPEIAARA